MVGRKVGYLEEIYVTDSQMLRILRILWVFPTHSRMLHLFLYIGEVERGLEIWKLADQARTANEGRKHT